MSPGPNDGVRTTTEEPGYVSARFLTDFFSALSRRGVDARSLIGDLPISVDAQGRVTRIVEWAHFVDFLRRLENQVEGADGLEKLGEMICEMKPARLLQSLAGLTASPFMLYRAASQWALRRALPGVQSSIEQISETDLVIRACVPETLRSCPQLFHIAIGGARALPRILGMPDAVVSPEIGEREAVFQITVPPSRTMTARVRRFRQMLFSAGSVMRFLEDQQLELHAKHDALMRAHAELEKSEQRHRELTDAAVDVLCEIDEDGQVSYVSAAISELLGYTPDQVTGSHFRLWIPTEYHAVVTERFERLFTESAGQSSIRERLTLHAAGGRRVPVEMMARTYCLSDRSSEEGFPSNSSALPAAEPATHRRTRGWEGAWRFVATLRALGDQPTSAQQEPQASRAFSDREPILPSSKTTPPTHLAQAVEHALLDSADEIQQGDWIDTHKLIDRAQFALQNHDTFSLRVDTANGPAQIAGDEELLAACLRGLLAWGAARLGAKTAPHAFARSTPPQKLLLRIEKEPDDAVRFSVGIDWPRVASLEKIYAKKPRASAGESPAALLACLTEAQDAARALGGHLVTRSGEAQPHAGPKNGEASSPTSPLSPLSPLDAAIDPHATEQTMLIPQPSRATQATLEDR